MARSTMSNLIEQLRGMAHAAQSDYTIGAVDYWSDDQLQQVLDRHRTEIYRRMLTPYPKVISGGSLEWYEYRSGLQNLERTSGGTALFIVEDSTGADAGTALWSADYNTGIVTFASDTNGTEYYLTGRTYNMNAAAAEVWGQKIGHYAASVDFSTDNMSVRRGQLLTNARDMYNHFVTQAGPQTSNAQRSDLR